MAAFIGPALLRRLVARKSGVPEDMVEQVVVCLEDCVLDLVRRGGRVRMLGIGYFELKKTKATRRWSPMTEGFVKVPARKKIVFRESRKK